LWHLPSQLSFRTFINHIHEAPENTLVTLEATVELHQPGLRKRSPYRIWMRDNKNNRFELLFLMLTIGFYSVQRLRAEKLVLVVN
jgi:RecG-like helicase